MSVPAAARLKGISLFRVDFSLASVGTTWKANPQGLWISHCNGSDSYGKKHPPAPEPLEKPALSPPMHHPSPFIHTAPSQNVSGFKRGQDIFK